MSPQDTEALQKVVLAGQAIMYDEKVFETSKHSMMDESKPIVERLAMNAAGLMKMLFEKSGHKIPPQIIAPAAAMLLIEMAKFMKDAGLAAPTSDEVRQATGELMKLLKQVFAGQGKQPPAAAPQQQPPAAGGMMQPQGAM